jgi:hypothetical protein
MNLVFSRKEFVKLLTTLSVKKFSDTILGLAYLRSHIFRRVSSFYFLTIAWAAVYLVFKWANRAPIIAGKRRKKRLADHQSFEKSFANHQRTDESFSDHQMIDKRYETNQIDAKQVEDIIERMYNVIVARVEAQRTNVIESENFLMSLNRYLKKFQIRFFLITWSNTS